MSSTTPDVLDALQALVADFAHQHHCPTISWGLVRDGALAHAGSFGTLEVPADAAGPPDAHTVYRIASMTKSFTAAAVLGLRDEGQLSIDVPVSDYAPELAAVRGPAGSPPITLRHLMSMTSGLATDDAWADRHLDIDAASIDGVYAAGPSFAHLTNVAYEYSNLGFGMIGRTVQRATGRRVQEHVSERLLGPLGLAETSWTEPTDRRWARPYRWEDEQFVPDLPHPIGDGEIAPMGGIWTTVHDLARWVAWLDDANVHPHQPDAVGLSPASRREMQRFNTYVGRTTLAGRTSPAGYGFGLNLRDDADLGIVVSHSGGLPGYGSNMRWIAGSGVGVVALSNVTYAPMSELTMRMLVHLHELGALPSRPPLVAPAVDAAAHRLVALLNNWTDAAADQLFADNVALDEAYARRAAAAAKLVATHGPLRVVAVHPESATSGEVEVQGSGEPFRIDVQLAPLAGTPVQLYGLPD
jgi:CubicO group peptidase (beta-lactamase class C family)